MRFISIAISIVLFFSYVQMSSGQSTMSYNMVFRGTEPNNIAAFKEYRLILSDKLLQKLLEIRKFTILNRSKDVLKAIESELEMNDFIEPETAINLGKMLGASYYLIANVSQFSCEKLVQTTTNNTVDYFYKCSIAGSIKVINLETGQYLNNVLTNVEINSADRNDCILKALDQLAISLAEKLSKEFPIQTTITKILSQDDVLINKGLLQGIKRMSVFELQEKNLDDHSPISLRIIDVYENSSRARVIEGSITGLSDGLAIIESFDERFNTAKVEARNHDRVTINAGENIGIKKGSIFNKKQLEQDMLSKAKNTRKLSPAYVYITEVDQNQSFGRIINGYKEFDIGSLVVQADDKFNHRITILSFDYKFNTGLQVNANKANGLVDVVNSTGTYTVDTDYFNNYTNINGASIFSLGIGTINPIRKLVTVLSFDRYDMYPLKNWIFHLDVGYRYTLIPDRFFLNLTPSIGYGGLKQVLPDNIIQRISDNHSSNIKSNSIFLGGRTELNFVVKAFIFRAGLSYDYLNYSDWEYEVSIEDVEKTVRISEDIVPYEKVNLTGLYYNVGLSYQFIR